MSLATEVLEFVSESGADLDDDYYAPREVTVSFEGFAPEIEATYSLNDPTEERMLHIPSPGFEGEDDDTLPVSVTRTLTPSGDLNAKLRSLHEELHGYIPVPDPVSADNLQLEVTPSGVTGTAYLKHETPGGGLHQTLVRLLTAGNEEVRPDDINTVLFRFERGTRNRFKVWFDTEEPVPYSPTSATIEEFCEFRAGFPEESRTTTELMRADAYEVTDYFTSSEASSAVESARSARMEALLSLPDRATVDYKRFETTRDSETISARVELPFDV